MSIEYIDNTINVAKFLLENCGKCVSENEIYSVSPRYGFKILNNLIDDNIVSSTKDGITFDEDDIPALNSFLSEIREEMPEDESWKDVLNRFVGLLSDISNIINTGFNILNRN